MIELSLRVFHESRGARFGEVADRQVVQSYGDVGEEYRALRETAAVLDLSPRDRIVLTGADRQRFLHGQVTNNIKDLAVGEGCYAALVNAKGRIESDTHVYCLPEEFLLDLEPGMAERVVSRFDKYIIADDVQAVDAAPHYGLMSVQGPRAGAVVNRVYSGLSLPAQELTFTSIEDSESNSETYCMNHPRTTATGFELYVPNDLMESVAGKLISAAQAEGGRECGWDALEVARVEAGIPRFGLDMDETNLAPETGIESRAISYTKGCYVGQEVIARIRTYGQVAKALRGLQLADDLTSLPEKGDKLFHDGQEVGYITSAVRSPLCRGNIALGYIRREHFEVGTKLRLRSAAGESLARVTRRAFEPVRAVSTS